MVSRDVFFFRVFFFGVNMGGMRGLKDDETLYEHMFFGAVFVNTWDPFLSLCLVGSSSLVVGCFFFNI